MASNTEITEQPSLEKVTDPTETPLQHITPPPTVQIWELKPDQVYSHGTGFIFDKDGHVATAAHVLEDSEGNILPRIGVHTEAGDLFTAHLEKLDDINDVAILKIDVGTPQYTPPLKLAPEGSDLKPNDPLRIWGYPQGVAHAYIAPAIFWGKTQLRSIFTGSTDRDACLSHATDAYVSSVSSDGSTTPPYHMQMYNFIRKRCNN